MAPDTTTTTGTGRRAGLDRDDVVDAAVALVSAGGADALTMRKLAAELDVTTTTIYWHVGNRDQLILAVIERVSRQQARVRIDATEPTERILAVATHVWRSALRHRHVTSLAYQVGATSLLELPLEVALARELEAAGITGDDARDGLRAILMSVAGFLVVGMRSPVTVAPEHRGEALWAGVRDDHLSPATIAAMQTKPDLPPLFDATLRAVIADIVARCPGDRP